MSQHNTSFLSNHVDMLCYIVNSLWNLLQSLQHWLIVMDILLWLMAPSNYYYFNVNMLQAMYI